MILLEARRLEQLRLTSGDEVAEFSWLERCPQILSAECPPRYQSHLGKCEFPHSNQLEQGGVRVIKDRTRNSRSIRLTDEWRHSVHYRIVGNRLGTEKRACCLETHP